MLQDGVGVSFQVVVNPAGTGPDAAPARRATTQAQAQARLVDAIAGVPGLVQAAGCGAEEFANALTERADPASGMVDLRELPALTGDTWLRLPAAAWMALDDWMKAEAPEGLRQLALPAAPSAADLTGLPAAIGGLGNLDLLCLMAPRQGMQVDLSGLGSQVAHPHVVLALSPGAAACEVLLPRNISMEFDSGGVISPSRLAVHRVPARGGTPAPGDAGKPAAGPAGAIPHKGETPLGLVYFSTPRQASAGQDPADGKASTPTSLLNLNGRVGFNAQQAAAADLDVNTIVCRHISLKWIQDRQSWLAAKQDTYAAAPEADFYERYKTQEMLQDHIPAAIDAQVRQAYAAWPRESVPPGTFGDFLARELARLEPPGYRHFVAASPNHAMAVELRAKQRGDGTTAYVVNFYDPNRTATHLRIAVSSPDRLEGKPLAHWLTPAFLRAYGLNTACLTVLACPGPAAGAGQSSGVAALQAGPEATRTGAGETAVGQAMGGEDAGTISAALERVLAQRPVDRDKLLEQLHSRDTQGRPALYIALRYGSAAAVEAFVKAVVSAPDSVLSPLDRVELLRAMRRDTSGTEKPGLSVVAARHSVEAVTAYARGILEAPPGALTPQHQVELLGAPHETNEGLAPLQALALSATGWHGALRTQRPVAVHSLAREITSARHLSLAQKSQLLWRPALLQTGEGLRAAGHEPAAAAATTLALLTAILESDLPWVDRQALAAGVCADPASCLPTAGAPEAQWGARLLTQLQRADVPSSDSWAQGLRQAGPNR